MLANVFLIVYHLQAIEGSLILLNSGYPNDFLEVHFSIGNTWKIKFGKVRCHKLNTEIRYLKQPCEFSWYFSIFIYLLLCIKHTRVFQSQLGPDQAEALSAGSRDPGRAVQTAIAELTSQHSAAQRNVPDNQKRYKQKKSMVEIRTA